MSHAAVHERERRSPRRGADAGFTMLEIVVAIAILGVAMAAAGPQMVASVQASSTAKLVARAKGVMQGQLDAMRTLPFRVSPTAGDHRDLLDTYYRDLTPPSAAPACLQGAAAGPRTASTGYVSWTDGGRCPYEPAAGAFYRTVIAPGTADLPAGFALVLDTTFVAPTANPTVLVPAAGYNTQRAGLDTPPSSQVGVTATVLYPLHGGWKPITAYTQIAARTATDLRIKLDARATAVEIGAGRISGEGLTLTGGQLDLAGSLSTTSRARANLSAFRASSSLTGRQEGAALAVEAPYANAVPITAGADDPTAVCTATCWAPSSIPSFVAAADNGLPRVGVPTLPGLLDPVQTQVPETLTRSGFQFLAENPTLPGLSSTLVSMDPRPAGYTAGNLVQSLYNCAFSGTGTPSHLTASGYLNSTDDRATANPLAAEACGGAHADMIRVFPTSFAPDGLLRITVRSAAHCRVAGIGHTPSTDVSYRAEVQYWTWTPDPLAPYGGGAGHGDYVSAGVITPTTTDDPLAAISLATPVSDTAVLGDYIESITGLTHDRVTAAGAGHVAEVTIPAVVAVQTQPVAGAANPGTAVSIAVGAASCRAEDNR